MYVQQWQDRPDDTGLGSKPPTRQQRKGTAAKPAQDRFGMANRDVPGIGGAAPQQTPRLGRGVCWRTGGTAPPSSLAQSAGREPYLHLLPNDSDSGGRREGSARGGGFLPSRPPTADKPALTAVYV